jgi:hypothetical protein
MESYPQEDEMCGACSKYGEICVQVLMSKPEGKKLLGRPRRRWEDNAEMVLQEFGGGVN